MPKAIRDMIEADLLCIGSGPAGQRAAVQAAKLGKRVVVIEKRRVVGGVCLDTGTIPSKTFREAVLAFGRQAEQFRKRHGFAVPARLGVDQLFARVNEVVEREGEVVPTATGTQRHHGDPGVKRRSLTSTPFKSLQKRPCNGCRHNTS